ARHRERRSPRAASSRVGARLRAHAGDGRLRRPSLTVSETVVGQFEDEIEAEAAAGHLRSLELDARVRYRATMGVPRSLAPIRVVSPFGAYEVVVPETQGREAREALAGVEH